MKEIEKSIINELLKINESFFNINTKLTRAWMKSCEDVDKERMAKLQAVAFIAKSGNLHAFREFEQITASMTEVELRGMLLESIFPGEKLPIM